MASTQHQSRLVALDILQAVLRRKQSFDDTMDRHPGLQKLEPRDRGFVHLMVATVLRRVGQIDEAIRSCLDKPQELKARTQDILRLGAAQLLFLGTPPHAAVDTAVTLASEDTTTLPYKGLINAVLRRLSREGAEIVRKQDPVKQNFPPWLWLSWRKAYGVALARAIADASLSEALIDISVKSEPAVWAEKMKARLLPTGSLRLDSSASIPTLEGFSEGAWWVQDAAAALPALLLGDVQGKKVIDLCAAPGGKTLQLAARGADVMALDRAEPRLKRLRENLTRMGLKAEIVNADALNFKPGFKVEKLLLDAPCSSTGTLRRHPDVLRLKDQTDVERLAGLQKRLLDHVFQHLVAPGGTVVYAVCSLQPEEAEDQVEALLARNPAVKRNPIKPDEIPGIADFITEKGDMRCLPSHWREYAGIDGFFASRLSLS